MFYLLLVVVLNLKLGAHRVRWNGGQVKDAHRVAGVGWLGTEVAVGVTQVAADRLGETNLGTWVQEVLARQDGVWRKLTEVLGRDHLLGNQTHVGVVVDWHVYGAQTGTTHLERGWLIDRSIRTAWIIGETTLRYETTLATLVDHRARARDGRRGYACADWVGLRWHIAATLRIKYHHGNQEQKNQNRQTLAVHVIIVHDFFFQSR